MLSSNKTNHFIHSIDLGTHAIKTLTIDLQANTDDSKLYVASAANIESRGIRKGVIINIDNTVGSISEVIARSQSLSLQEIKNVQLGISGMHLKGENSSGVAKVRFQEVSNDDLDRVDEAARAVPVPYDREIIHVINRNYTVDGNHGIKDPLGISAIRLESLVHIVTGSTSSIQNCLKCLNRCGLKADDLIFNGIASAVAVTSEEERAQGVCVVDIGSGTADIVIYQDGQVASSLSLPLGGNLITKDLASGLRISALNAEKLKCEHGVATTQSVSGESRIEVQGISNQASKLVSKTEIASIIECRVVEIMELISEHIDESGYRHRLTAGVVITGGTANLQSIIVPAETVLKLPVRIGKPLLMAGLADFVDEPQYATAVGLIKHALVSQHAANFRDLTGWRKPYRKVANWFHEHF